MEKRKLWGHLIEIYPRSVVSEKQRVPRLSYSVVCLILYLAVLIEYRLLTDRQTDGQTDIHMATAYTPLA